MFTRKIFDDALIEDERWTEAAFAVDAKPKTVQRMIIERNQPVHLLAAGGLQGHASHLGDKDKTAPVGINLD